MTTAILQVAFEFVRDIIDAINGGSKTDDELLTELEQAHDRAAIAMKGLRGVLAKNTANAEAILAQAEDGVPKEVKE